jgi:hypothetical protein
MNWGKGLAIAMVGFMLFILYMVITLMSKGTDLESEDYYQKEIDFEQEISAISNMNGLKEKIDVSQNDDFVMVKFPEIEDMDSIEVMMFRPNNEKDDQFFILKNSKSLLIPKSKLNMGIYEMDIQFKIKDKVYLQKETIRITKKAQNKAA